jgi:ribonuclease HI
MPAESFDFGITSTKEMGDVEGMEFLLGDDNIEDINTPKPPKPEPKPKETPKPPVKEEESGIAVKEESTEEDLEGLLGGEEEPVKSKKEPEEEEEINPYSSIASTLFEQGILTPDGEELPEITTPEELLAAFQQEKQKGATEVLQTFLGRFGEDYQKAFEAIYVHGVNPAEYFTTLSAIEDYSTLDMNSESVQEQVVREYYKKLGWKDQRINRNIQLWKESAELEENAKEMQQELVEKHQQSLAQKVEEERQKKAGEQQADQQYRQNISKILQETLKKKELDGIPVNEKTAQQAFDFLYTKKYRMGNRELTEWDNFILSLNKPENHNLKVKIALLKANDFDFSVIKNKVLSKESNSLFGQLSTKTTKSKKEALKNEDEPFFI